MTFRCLLERIAVALESQVAMMALDVTDRQTQRARNAAAEARREEELDAHLKAQMDMLHTTLQNQAVGLAQQAEHAAQCEAVHRRLEAQYGLRPDEPRTGIQ